MTTQGECGEEKKETNSAQEEHDVSNRQMTWWRGAWQRPTPTDGARPSKSVASSLESRGKRARQSKRQRVRSGDRKKEKTKRDCAVKILYT